MRQLGRAADTCRRTAPFRWVLGGGFGGMTRWILCRPLRRFLRTSWVLRWASSRNPSVAARRSAPPLARFGFSTLRILGGFGFARARAARGGVGKVVIGTTWLPPLTAGFRLAVALAAFTRAVRGGAGVIVVVGTRLATLATPAAAAEGGGGGGGGRPRR